MNSGVAMVLRRGCVGVLLSMSADNAHERDTEVFLCVS